MIYLIFLFISLFEGSINGYLRSLFLDLVFLINLFFVVWMFLLIDLK